LARFLHVNLPENRSGFKAPFEGSLRNAGDDYVGKVSGAIARADTIACGGEAIDLLSIFIGLPLRDLMSHGAERWIKQKVSSIS
jgi:hypothetical protein